jgi:HEPN domain-containing protein
MSLHQKFFQAAEIDMNAARILAKANCSQPAIYHLQQAYEKCIKSYYIFKETTVNKSSDSEAYKKLKGLGHDTEESTRKLLHDIADLQRRNTNIQLCNASEPNIRQALRNLTNAINGFSTSVENMVARQNLKSAYHDNVINYAQVVTNLYNTYQNNTAQVITKQLEPNFLQIVFAMGILYPCFYKMDQITRYPLPEFSYDNLNLFTNLSQACEQLNEMLGDLIVILRPYLS